MSEPTYDLPNLSLLGNGHLSGVDTCHKAPLKRALGAHERGARLVTKLIVAASLMSHENGLPEVWALLQS
jgi:hypothetical protein